MVDGQVQTRRLPLRWVDRSARHSALGSGFLTGKYRSEKEALAFTRLQTLRLVILPQCVKRIMPPWMNLYAIVVVATPLTSIVGVSEAMTLTGDVLSSEGRTELLVPMYLYLLSWFFIYCYPIARATVAVERRFAVR
jgi:polar amino acid transport system permease protein